jgi:alpha-beta hydrolase superfamily lysophospholipase
LPCTDVLFDGVNVKLSGWQCRSAPPARASLVFLHGVADNRGSVAGLVERYAARRLDVVAYDSRAHGESTGEACTYGYWDYLGSNPSVPATECALCFQ